MPARPAGEVGTRRGRRPPGAVRPHVSKIASGLPRSANAERAIAETENSRFVFSGHRRWSSTAVISSGSEAAGRARFVWSRLVSKATSDGHRRGEVGSGGWLVLPSPPHTASAPATVVAGADLHWCPEGDTCANHRNSPAETMIEHAIRRRAPRRESCNAVGLGAAGGPSASHACRSSSAHGPMHLRNRGAAVLAIGVGAAMALCGGRCAGATTVAGHVDSRIAPPATPLLRNRRGRPISRGRYHQLWQPSCVFLGQVDLVTDTIHRKRHRLRRLRTTVEIIDNRHHNLARHADTPLRTRWVRCHRPAPLGLRLARLDGRVSPPPSHHRRIRLPH
ncbi:hypothetical protein APR09_001815 [Nocardia amikacinitolerans]|nr:hypothetical protein [Nocardia amikacinitolerans]